MLGVGQKFPSFKLKATVSTELKSAFADISNETYKGKWLVVFFYPKDFTFVCPTEIAEFARLAKDFEDRDAIVLGGSTEAEGPFEWVELGDGDERLTAEMVIKGFVPPALLITLVGALLTLRSAVLLAVVHMLSLAAMAWMHLRGMWLLDLGPRTPAEVLLSHLMLTAASVAGAAIASRMVAGTPAPEGNGPPER